jgi:hypothetical protein
MLTNPFGLALRLVGIGTLRIDVVPIPGNRMLETNLHSCFPLPSVEKVSRVVDNPNALH